jgi:hypothetical protein
MPEIRDHRDGQGQPPPPPPPPEDDWKEPDASPEEGWPGGNVRDHRGDPKATTSTPPDLSGEPGGVKVTPTEGEGEAEQEDWKGAGGE